MDDLTPLIRSISAAVEAEGLPAIARRSGVPYTTLIDWQKAGWRPKSIQTLERLAKAASEHPANDDASPQERAA